MDATQSSAASSLKGSEGNGIVNLKILVPGVAAGAIIGKGGETIAEVQKQAGGRVKMSKANDFYPGTNERVCLITGSIESVIVILDFILEKVREKPDPNAGPAIDFDNKISAEREKQVKVLVPNSTAGMIIGKGGSFIRQLKDDSGAFIQISQKSKDAALQERVVTIIGETENNRKAMAMILEKIHDDPQSGSCLNISYSDVQGLVANFNPTGSPYAVGNGDSSSSTLSPSRHQQSPAHPHQGSATPNGKVSPSTGGGQGGGGSQIGAPSPFVLPLHHGGALQLKFNMNPNRTPTDPALMSQYLDHIKVALHSHGYADGAVIEEIARAISCLASHGILVVNLVTTHSAAAQGNQAAGASNGFSSTSPPSSSTTNPNAAAAALQLPFHQGSGGLQAPDDFVGRNNSGQSTSSFSHHTRPPPPGTVQQPGSAAGGGFSDQQNLGFGFSTSSGHHPHHPHGNYSRYWSPSNNSTPGGNDTLTHILAPPGVHQVHEAAAAPGQHPSNLPEPFRGPAAPQSPFSQQQNHSNKFSSHHQGNKNSFGLPPPQPPPPLQMQPQSQQLHQQQQASVNGNNGHNGHLDQHPIEHMEQVELEVNESIIGAVIGPQGKCIVDIQKLSGARIQISKKGTFSPGTRNRIVNVQGSQKAIQAAKYFIEKKILEEEGKRESASTAAGTNSSNAGGPPTSAGTNATGANGGAGAGGATNNNY